MIDIKIKTHEILSSLIGLELSRANRAADMLTLQFGNLTVLTNNKSVGEIALHIQCPWRIESASEIITGRTDLWEPASTDSFDWETWHYEDGNLQDYKMANLFQTFTSEERTVASITTDTYGGAQIMYRNGYRLTIFPSGSEGEDWRIFRHRVDSEPHFVISGGKIEEQHE